MTAADSESTRAVPGVFARLRWAWRCPTYALVRLIFGPTSARLRQLNLSRRTRSLSSILNAPATQIQTFLDESRESPILRSVEQTRSALPYLGYFRGAPELYSTIRALKPRRVIETGVGSGYSSTYILTALRQNGGGRLYSIESLSMSQGWSLPSEKGPGFLVPTELRPDWDLIIGDSLEILPDLLKSLGTIDMFFHDSDHSYDHMMGEFRLAFPYLANGGCLVSDDVTSNTAFLDFSRLFERTPQLIYHHETGSPFGAVVK